MARAHGWYAWLAPGVTALFEVFDEDGDGYAKEEDVAKVFRMLYGIYFDNEQVADMAHAAFVQADVDADGLLSFREFVRVRPQPHAGHAVGARGRPLQRGVTVGWQLASPSARVRSSCHTRTSCTASGECCEVRRASDGLQRDRREGAVT